MESSKISKLKNLINKIIFNVDHAIELLKSEDEAVLEKALNSLLKYSEESEKNASTLFKKDVIRIFNDLLPKVETRNVAVILKVITRIIKTGPECLDYILIEINTPILYEINKLFLTTNDEMLQGLSADLLSYVSINTPGTNNLLTTNVVSAIFARLETVHDLTLTFSLIHYLDSLLMAKHARYVFIGNHDFHLIVLFRCITIPLDIIQNAAFDILDTLISWKMYAIEMRLRRAELMENMLNYIMDDEYESFHDRAFKVIYDCCESDEIASYFMDGKEFINFRRWSKTCEDKYIFFSAAFLTLMTRSSVTRERLIRSSIDDTVLSYLRCNDPPIFYKNCQLFCNLMRSASCPLSLTNDNVIHYIIEMLQCNDCELLPYHEIALKTLSFFMMCRLESLPIFVRNDGINTIYQVLQNWNQFTDDGLISIMKLIYVFCTSYSCNFVLDRNIYQIVITCFSKSSVELSKQALQVLDVKLEDANFFNHFLEFAGPNILLKKLESIEDNDLYRKMLSFVHNLISIDVLGKYMLFQTDIFPTLNSFSSIIIHRFPKIRQVLHLLCELHRELKFYKYGILPPEITCDNGFYIIDDTRGFCFIENMLENCASPFYNMYVVNFEGPPHIDLTEEQEVPLELTPVASTHTGCTCSFSSHLGTRILCSLCRGKTNEAPSVILPVVPQRPVQSQFGYGFDLKMVNYGTLSPDPFLSKHIENLTGEMANSDFITKVEKLARYVVATIREPNSTHAFFDHIMQLKDILGTSMIPIGYLRFGYECERALLFKALADKLNLPVSLHKKYTHNLTEDFMYWNEISNEYNEKYIVDLMDNVGDLIGVGHPKSFEYCSSTNKR